MPSYKEQKVVCKFDPVGSTELLYRGPVSALFSHSNRFIYAFSVAWPHVTVLPFQRRVALDEAPGLAEARPGLDAQSAAVVFFVPEGFAVR